MSMYQTDINENGFRRFKITRSTGCTLEGIQFTDGTCALRWISSKPTTVIHSDINTVMEIHLVNVGDTFEWLDK